MECHSPAPAVRYKLNANEKRERNARLVKRNVQLNRLHPNLSKLVVGDFLSQTRPKRKMAEVVKKYEVAMLLQFLLPQNPRPYMLPMLEKANVRTVYDAARILFELNRIAKLGRTVFSLFWKDIARLALPVEKHSQVAGVRQEKKNKTKMAHEAKQWNEVFAFIERRRISWELSPRDLRAEIAFELEAENGGDQDYFLLLNSFPFTDFWMLRKQYPTHPFHQKNVIKARIAEFLQQRKAKKLPAVLKAEFKRHGVEMSDDWELVQDFSAGMVFCHPIQVVATLYAKMRRSQQDMPNLKKELTKLVYGKRLGWMEAAKALTESPEFDHNC
ncbi:hypothetical protein HDU96_001187 [Phlyctochytrium bullatum]|nr:hypothetical protein HDU96_001187 [Phlyctochytrium bullatum]